MKYILILWFIIYLLTFNFAYKNLKQCKLRMPLTYFILTLLIIGVVLILKYLDINNYHPFNNLILFIINIIIIFILSYSSKNSIIRLVFFTIFIVIISISLYPIYILGKQKNLNMSVFISIIGLFLSLTLCSILFPKFISFSWLPVLSLSLLGLILFRLGFYFSGQSVKSSVYK